MRVVDLQVQYEDGIYVAAGHEDLDGVRYSIIAEGETWEALKADVQDVVHALYADLGKPERIALHLLHDEELQVA